MTSCAFPEWLRSSTWSDLSGKHKFSAAEDMHTFSGHSTQDQGQVTLSMRCVTLLLDASPKLLQAISLTVHGW